MTEFADVSSWQSNVNLSAYQAGGSTQISLKATEGGAYVDPPFAERWQQAKALGLTRWAYHFAQPGDPVNDAQHFLATINNAGGLVSSDRLMLDFESVAWSNSGMWGVAHAYAISFFNELRSLVGPAQPMLIYSYHDYEQNSHVVRSDLPSVGLVIAAYGSGYTLPDGWDHACVWQFTDGKVGQVTYFPGIGTCDANRQLCDLHDCIEGDEDELTPDDKAWLESTIKQAVSDGVKAELTFLIGTRTTPADKPAGPPTISNVADALYLMSHGDATHPWSLTGISASVADTQSRIANLQTGQVDPAAVKAAVAGLKVTGVLSE